MNTASNQNLIDLGGNGQLNIKGAISQVNGFLDIANSATVNYNGANQTVRPFAYPNLQLSGTGVKIISGVTVTNVLTLSDAAEATTSNVMTVEDVLLNNASSLTLGNTFTISDELTIGTGSTLTLGGFNFSVGDMTIINGTLINNSTTGTKTFEDVTINDGGLFNSTVDEAFTFSRHLHVNGSGSIVSGAGTWTFTGAGDLTGTGAATITSALFPSNYTNTGNFTFTNLSVTAQYRNNGTTTVTNSLVGSGEFMQGSTGVFYFSGNSVALTGDFDVDANGNIVNYNGAAQTIKSETYSNLVLSGSGAKTMTAVEIEALLSIQGIATVAGTSPTYNAAAILEYKGSAGQTTSNIEFAGTGATPAHVRIDNANGVDLNASKSINGTLSLVNGYLSTSGSELLTINANGNATTVNGAFVNGPLAKVKTSTTLFTFPVGNLTGGLRTIGVTPQSTANTTFTALFISGDPRSVSNGTNLGSLVQISGCEYWDLTRTGAANSALVTLSWPIATNSCGSASYVGNIATLLVAHHNGSNWVNEGQSSNTGTPSAGGTITSLNYVASFSPFALGTSNASQNPLPVMFADVKAFQKNEGIQVEWTNLTEKDIVHYTIERSTDGTNFNAIGEQQPRGNRNDKEGYLLFDATPATGSNFYRIRVTELSGKVVYSKVLRVDLGLTPQAFTLYPNPVKGTQLTVGLNSKAGHYTIKVLNTSGQQVFMKRLVHQGGSITQNIELPSSIKPGVYNISVIGDHFHQAKMFIVQ
jgi:hypothetical protein